jgi:hypothetical protein
MTATHSAPTTEQIAALAHKFWEDEGHPEGRAESHWLRATETLAAKPAKSAPKAAPAPRAKAVKAKAR